MSAQHKKNDFLFIADIFFFFLWPGNPTQTFTIAFFTLQHTNLQCTPEEVTEMQKTSAGGLPLPPTSTDVPTHRQGDNSWDI